MKKMKGIRVVVIAGAVFATVAVRPAPAEAFTQIFGPFTEVAWRLAQLTWITTATAIHKANAEAEKEAALKAGSEKVEPVGEQPVVEPSPVQVEPAPDAPKAAEPAAAQ